MSYKIITSLPTNETIFNSIADTSAWFRGDIITMPITSDDYTSLSLNTTNITSGYIRTYKGSRVEYSLMRVISGDGSSYSSQISCHDYYYATSHNGNIGVPALIDEDSSLYSALLNRGVTFHNCGVMDIGEYKIDTLNNMTAETTDLFWFSSGYRTHHASVFYPIRNVYINGVLYKWVAPRQTDSYGHESGTSFSGSTVSMSTVYVAQEGDDSLRSLSLKSGDIIKLTEPYMLRCWSKWLNINTSRIWDNNYTIYSYNGVNELGKITEAPPISTIKITNAGVIEIRYSGEPDKIYTTTIDIPIVEDKTFIGLSLKPYTNIATIPSDSEEHEIVINGSTNFYLAYSKVNRPITEPFDMNLYQSTTELNRVDKTNYLTSTGVLSGVLREECSITEPSINIQLEGVPNFNYVYIPIFGRYYFVTNITSIKQNLWNISLEVDVLMTYKDSIYSLYGFIERNENEYNPEIIDTKRVVEQGFNVEEHTIQNSVFSANGSYVLNAFGCKTYIEEEQS